MGYMTCSASGSSGSGCAGAGEHRQCDPLTDHGHVPGPEQRPGGLLQPGEVRGHQGRVVAGSRPVRTGDQDQQWSRHGRNTRQTCRIDNNEKEYACCLPSAGTCCWPARRDGRLVAKDLAAELGVSEDSVRRDLRELAAAGLCQRVYGGALPASPAVADYADPRRVEPDSKQRVAAAAVGSSSPGSTVLLDGGTTALAVARALPGPVGHRRDAQPDGRRGPGRAPERRGVRARWPAVQALRGHLRRGRRRGGAAVSADLFLLGVTGVHHQAGLTTGDADEAAMKRALARRAADTYVLASAEKIGAASPFTVLPLSAVTGIITDAATDHEVLEQLRRDGVPVISAG